MIYAIIRQETERDVIASLEKAGIYPYTRYGVFGRGRQKGLQIGSARYEELAKVTLMLAVEEADAARAVETIKIAARTGNPGDGKIFISSLSEVRTVRKKM